MNEIDFNVYKVQAKAKIQGQFKNISELYKSLQRYVEREKFDEALAVTTAYENASTELADMIRTMECDIREGEDELLKVKEQKEKDEFHAQYGGNILEAPTNEENDPFTLAKLAIDIRFYLEAKETFTFDEIKEELSLPHSDAQTAVLKLKELEVITFDEENSYWVVNHDKIGRVNEEETFFQEEAPLEFDSKQEDALCEESDNEDSTNPAESLVDLLPTIRSYLKAKDTFKWEDMAEELNIPSQSGVHLVQMLSRCDVITLANDPKEGWIVNYSTGKLSKKAFLEAGRSNNGQ